MVEPLSGVRIAGSAPSQIPTAASLRLALLRAQSPSGCSQLLAPSDELSDGPRPRAPTARRPPASVVTLGALLLYVAFGSPGSRRRCARTRRAARAREHRCGGGIARQPPSALDARLAQFSGEEPLFPLARRRGAAAAVVAAAAADGPGRRRPRRRRRRRRLVDHRGRRRRRRHRRRRRGHLRRRPPRWSTSRCSARSLAPSSRSRSSSSASSAARGAAISRSRRRRRAGGRRAAAPPTARPASLRAPTTAAPPTTATRALAVEDK